MLTLLFIVRSLAVTRSARGLAHSATLTLSSVGLLPFASTPTLSLRGTGRTLHALPSRTLSPAP